MKNLIILAFAFVAFLGTAEAQKSRKEIKIAAAYYWTDVNGYQLIFADREGRLEVIDEAKKADPGYNPEITIIKDEKAGVWRVAETMEEAGRLADDMAVARRPREKIYAYKRTKYN